MRFFKHGDVLAIAVPESLRKKLALGEGDEYDFYEVENGILALVKKDAMPQVIARQVQAVLKNQSTSQMPNQSTTQTSSSKASEFQTANQSLSKTPTAASAGMQNADWQHQGFTVVEDENRAKSFSVQYERQIKSGQIRGVRGFDKKFYLSTGDFFAAASGKILGALKDKGKTAEALAIESKIPLAGCLTVLYLLKEEGEVLERKRGEFSVVR